MACLPCLLSSHATFIQKTPSVVIHIYIFIPAWEDTTTEPWQTTVALKTSSFIHIYLYMPECICISLMSWEVTQMFREILKLMAVVIVR